MENPREDLIGSDDGSLDAFIQVVTSLERSVYRFASLFTGSGLIAEEALAQVFLKARNQLLHRNRSEQLEWCLQETLASIAEISQSPTFLENTQTGSTDKKDYLAKIIAILPGEYKASFILHDILRLDLSLTAKVLLLSTEETRTVLSRARAMLLRHLSTADILELHGFSEKVDYASTLVS